MPDAKDVAVIRELAKQVAELAALPAQEEKRHLWRKLNGLEAVRPMVMIDQICWNEMGIELQCTDADCRAQESYLRTTLYRWDHFPVDMVVEPFVSVPKAVHNTGFALGAREEIAVSDPTSGVVGHKYENQFNTEADLKKIRISEIVHDEAETERRLAIAHELFDGLLEVRASGVNPYLSFWDPIASWMSVEGALYALVDKPGLVHGILSRMTDGYLRMLDQLEEQGLLCQPQSFIHCTGAYTNELPAEGYDPEKPRTKDIWMFGLAQMLATVSPEMFKEFEVDYASRICERFGLVYYGCCDPLDLKMAEVRMIPNVRKVSMSPWVDQDRGAAEIGRDFVFSRKPSPALLATDDFHPDQVRSDLVATREICERHGCPLEFILKDISTIRYEPQRLAEWARIAIEVAEGS